MVFIYWLMKSYEWCNNEIFYYVVIDLDPIKKLIDTITEAIWGVLLVWYFPQRYYNLM